MKFSELTEKKGPIIGAPKGSQKDSRLTPGTDDPSKYMRGGEWEAYKEPQGVNSNAGKIAGGKKKGTTKTKNKKISENKSIEQFADQGLAENPSRQYVDQLMRRAVKNGGMDPHLKGLYDPRGRFWIWDSEDENVWHMEVESALVDRYDFPEFDDWMHVVGPDLQREGYTDEQAQEYFNNEGGYIPIIISPVDKKKGGIGKIWSGSENALKTPEVSRALSESIRRIMVAEGIGDTLRGMRDKMMGIDFKERLTRDELRRFENNPDGELERGNGFLNASINDARAHGNEDMADKIRDLRLSFARHMNRGEYENAISMLKHASTLRYNAAFGEGLQSGGPGVSGDLVPADRHATTISMVKDTLDPNIKKSPKLAGSEAPTKFVKKQIKKSHDDRPGNISDITEVFDSQIKMTPDPRGDGFGFVYDVDGTNWKADVSGGNFFIVPWGKESPKFAGKNRTAGHALKAFSTGFNWLADEIKNGKIREPIDIVTSDQRLGRIFTKMSNRVAQMTGWELSDPEYIGNTTGMILSPPRTAEGINEAVNKILSEAIPRVTPQDYSADYDLRDDKNQESIGVASITHGVIELLSVRNDVVEDYNGHIMSRLLSTIVRDADAANANLAIPLDDPNDLQHKRFLERFGFRAVGEGIMKRNAGSVTPPSVPTARL